MEVTINTLYADVVNLRRELEIIKRVLLNEGKLTLWAKKTLKEAREEKEEKYVSLENL